jgi:predicted transcriptional regulator
MNEHNVVVRHYANGDFGVHARKHTGDNDVKIHEGWARAAPNVTSETYTRIRNGELVKVETVISNLSKSEAEDAKRYISQYLSYLNPDKKVIN